MLERLTIRPASLLRSKGRKALVVSINPKKLVSKVLRQVSSVCSLTLRLRSSTMIPALFTRMSSRPNFCSTNLSGGFEADAFISSGNQSNFILHNLSLLLVRSEQFVRAPSDGPEAERIKPEKVFPRQRLRLP